ncbi:MAG: 2Fe-2S iron-sulfur cluster-binding protein, partial [Anaerolineales bacterium]|nr:2Fe-2S iron-sulfur cluster-binding protein [Anaerolineales bacterium]
MNLQLTVNGISHRIEISPADTLFTILRRLGYHSVKFGDEQGLTGSDTVLFDNKPINACLMLAAQAEDHIIVTVEALGEHPDQGWKITDGLHPIQQAFIETGAIQCGYCTPAQVLAAKALLDKNPIPTDSEVREALSGILCRCTGYLKPVQAVLRAAARMRGEAVEPIEVGGILDLVGQSEEPISPTSLTTSTPETQVRITPRIIAIPQVQPFQRVGKPDIKVDAIKLVQGKPAFAADIEKRDMLVAKVLHSPFAHARIKKIDVSKSRALPGVAAVLTWQDIPRVVYSTAGQSDPIPGPLDTFSLDHKVRFVGDRVAFVAAETAEIAKHA